MDEDCEPSMEIAKQLTKPSIMEGLQNRKQRLTERLKEIDAAIAALTANPEILNVLELVGKASRY